MQTHTHTRTHTLVHTHNRTHTLMSIRQNFNCTDFDYTLPEHGEQKKGVREGAEGGEEKGRLLFLGGRRCRWSDGRATHTLIRNQTPSYRGQAPYVSSVAGAVAAAVVVGLKSPPHKYAPSPYPPFPHSSCSHNKLLCIFFSTSAQLKFVMSCKIS